MHDAHAIGSRFTRLIGLSCLGLFFLLSTQASAGLWAADEDNQALAEKIQTLEKQVAAGSRLKLVEQIEQLQQQLATISGQLEMQQHDIALLRTQQKTLYQDLDARLQAQKNVANIRTTAATPSQGNTPATSASASSPAHAHYQQAFNLVRKKQYPQAIKRFKALIKQYPKSSDAPNAYYWLAQIYRLQNKPSQAAIALKRIVHQYPKSVKAIKAKQQLRGLEH